MPLLGIDGLCDQIDENGQQIGRKINIADTFYNLCRLRKEKQETNKRGGDKNFEQYHLVGKKYLKTPIKLAHNLDPQ